MDTLIQMLVALGLMNAPAETQTVTPDTTAQSLGGGAPTVPPPSPPSH